jgi:FAD/FMN-containing dehydrogenase
MDFRAFRDSLHGRLVLSGHQEYESVRQVWNASVDKRPWAIAECANESDVRRAVAFATERDVPIAVRGSGHHAAGFAAVDNGLVIDLSRIVDVQIDASGQTARAGPGVVAGLLQREAKGFGLFLPVGTVSTVGLTGLTLGGGQGWFTSKYGLTCDNLTSADIVTAGGELVRAAEDENADLLWGLRGGGGNFGVVVSSEYRLHALSEVTAGTIAYPPEAAKDVLRHWRDSIVEAPDELGSMAIYVQAPEPMLLVAVCYAGSGPSAEEALQPFVSYGSPLQVAIGIMSIPDLGAMFDDASLSGSGNYWRSHRMRTISDSAVSAFVEHCRLGTSNEAMAWLVYYGGEFQRIGVTDTAYVHRDAPYEMGISARWPSNEGETPHISWAETFWKAMKQYSTGGIYSNWSSDVVSDSSAAAYGVNLERLRKLKHRYDPMNVFNRNFNVLPSA